ncbi:protein disulfide isomerase Creld1 [Cyprinus carpio]|uniref:Protein disulfide isomerase Creld1 n=1 Tax=Cyprinus carpio TaxID=7962 RepID=A0A9Q9ZK05_CYPCA|nr:protein disulfide isomerase Creld1 [Cyprinus carpio]
MSPSRMFFLSAVLCVALFHLISGQNCSEHCKTCGGPEKDQCLQCHTGYILHDNLCVDIDECGTDQERCPDNTYCFNTHGSYECKGCDKACVGCMGGGPARCRKCAAGYRSSGMRCIDIDECAEEVLACPGVSMFCENTEGSFHCQCAVGYTRRGDSCERSQTTASEKRVFLTTFRRMKLRFCSRCSSVLCCVHWPHWRLKGTWCSPLSLWGQWQPWLDTGSLIKAIE